MGIRSFIKASTKDHVEAIKDNLREIDIFECWAASHSTGEEALNYGLESGLLCNTIFYNDDPIAMYGVTPVESDGEYGVVWLLGTNETNRATTILVKEGHSWVDEMLGIRPILFNFVSVKNKRSIKWLKYLGFKFKDAAPYGFEKEPFHLFYKVKGVEDV
jgi:hypothetical protein